MIFAKSVRIKGTSYLKSETLPRAARPYSATTRVPFVSALDILSIR
jgi:hypothetical protein